eukprot:gene30029-38696_t
MVFKVQQNMMTQREKIASFGVVNLNKTSTGASAASQESNSISGKDETDNRNKTSKPPLPGSSAAAVSQGREKDKDTKIPQPPPPTPAAVSTVPSAVAYSYPYSAYVALPIVTPYADGNHYDGLIAALLTLRSWTCAMELIELVYVLATAPTTSAGDHAPGAESNKPSTAKSSGSTVPGTSAANPFSDKVAAVVAKLSADLNKGGSNGAEANPGGGSVNESKKPSGPASDEAVKKPTVLLDLRTWVQYELSTP